MHDVDSGRSGRTQEPTNTGATAPQQVWMLSGAVAKRLGVKTSTLKKWRQLGKGPAVSKRIGATVVVYSTDSVLEFERSWSEPAAEQIN